VPTLAWGDNNNNNNNNNNNYNGEGLKTIINFT
jgi:hypothetical protein